MPTEGSVIERSEVQPHIPETKDIRGDRTRNNEEQYSITRKIRQLGRRMLQMVQRPEKGEAPAPEQVLSPKEARIINRERARRISNEGCAVRSIISAVAFATGENHINATTEEWDARFKLKDEFAANQTGDMDSRIEIHEQGLMDLYAEYAEHDTPLGNALKQVNITRNKDEAEDKIIARIRSGEQVMVRIPGHIFHAGLDKKGQIIALSDQKVFTLVGKQRKYQKYNKVDLSDGTYRTFSVIPK